LLVEVLDDNGQPVKGEQEGRIIITSFNNKAMPFIRYELGDIAAIRNTEKESF
jgi:phenylacetate-CoA ligase